MGRLHKNIHLMLEFLTAPFLVLHFSYYTLMIFPMMLSVILLTVLMILLFNLSLNQAFILWSQLELAAELESDLRYTMDWERSDLLISMLEKLNLFRLTGLITLLLLMGY